MDFNIQNQHLFHEGPVPTQEDHPQQKQPPIKRQIYSIPTQQQQLSSNNNQAIINTNHRTSSNKEACILQLEQVIGLTASNRQALAFNNTTGDLTYPAGSVMVSYSIQQNKQTKFFFSPNKRPITCLCFSSDNRYLVAGEGVCKNPEILIWDLNSYTGNNSNNHFSQQLQQQTSQQQQYSYNQQIVQQQQQQQFQQQQNQISLQQQQLQGPLQQQQQLFSNASSQQQIVSFQLKGHKFGVKILLFSPNNKYLVSIGNGYDRGLFVWDWRNEVKLTLNKVSKEVNSACFSNDGTKLVTVGQQHLKFWYFDMAGEIIQIRAKEKDSTYIMECKNSNLGQKFLEKNFVDAQFTGGQDSNTLLALTMDGMLCIINEKRILEKWMDLKVSKALSMQINQQFIFCGCGDGIIRVFKQKTLEHLTTLPRPPTLNNYNIEKGITKLKPPKEGELYADCIALCYDPQKNKLCSVYSDKTMFIWDLRKIDNIHVKRSFLNHSGKINDMQLLQTQSSYDVTFFSTCSNDKTVCIWHILDEDEKETASADIQKMLGIRRNVYSKYMSRILYVTDYVEHFRYQDKQLQQQQQQQQSDLLLPQNAESSAQQQQQQQQQNQLQSEMEQLHIKCIRSSPDGQYLVAGDTFGTLYIFSLKSFELIKKVEAHDQEVSCLDFTPMNDAGLDLLLASGSRDRYIHVFNVQEDFALMATLDDHCSSIVALKFCYVKSSKMLYLVSCESDRTIIFRQYSSNSGSGLARDAQQSKEAENMTDQIVEGEDGDGGMAGVAEDRFMPAQQQIKQPYNISNNASNVHYGKNIIINNNNNNKQLQLLRQFTLVAREIDKACKFFCMEASSDNETLFCGQEKKISSCKLNQPCLCPNSNNNNKHQSQLQQQPQPHFTFGKQIETKEEDRQNPSSTSSNNNNNNNKILNLDNYKITLDPTGTYLASSNNDKVVRLRDVNSGQLLAKALPGDHTTGMLFTVNSKNLVTATSEGCVFIWKIPADIKNNIDKKKKQLGQIAKRIQEMFKEKQLMQSKEWLINSFWIEDELQQYIKSKEQQQQLPLQQQQQQMLIDVAANNNNNNANSHNLMVQNTPQSIKPQDLINFDNLPIWAQSNKDKKLAVQKSEDYDIPQNNQENSNFIANNNNNVNKFIQDQQQDYDSNQDINNNNKEEEKKLFEVVDKNDFQLKDENPAASNLIDQTHLLENYSKSIKQQEYDQQNEDKILDFEEDHFQKQLQLFESQQDQISKKDRNSMSSMFRSKKGQGLNSNLNDKINADQQQPQPNQNNKQNIKISFKYVNEQINLDSLFKKTNLNKDQEGVQQREQLKMDLDLKDVQHQLHEVNKNIQLVENFKKLQNESFKIPELKVCDNKQFEQLLFQEEEEDLDKQNVKQQKQQPPQNLQEIQQSNKSFLPQQQQQALQNNFMSNNNNEKQLHQQQENEPTLIKINKNLLVKKSKESIINKSNKQFDEVLQQPQQQQQPQPNIVTNNNPIPNNPIVTQKQTQKQEQFLEIVPDDPQQQQQQDDQLDILEFDEDFEFSSLQNQKAKEQQAKANNQLIQQILDNQFQDTLSIDQGQLDNDNILQFPTSQNNSPEKNQEHQSSNKKDHVIQQQQQQQHTPEAVHNLKNSSERKNQYKTNDEQQFQKILPSQSIQKLNPNPSDFQFVSNTIFRQDSTNEDIQNFQNQQIDDDIILLEPNNVVDDQQTNNNNTNTHFPPSPQQFQQQKQHISQIQQQQKQLQQQQQQQSSNNNTPINQTKLSNQQSPYINNASHYAQSEYEESRALFLENNNNNNNKSNFANDSGNKDNQIEQMTKTLENSFNSIQSSLDQVASVIGNLNKLKSQSSKDKIYSQINNQLFQMNNKVQNVSQIINKNSNQNSLAYSQITNMNNASFSNQQISELVLGASKDILENYSKLLIETIKSNINKK